MIDGLERLGFVRSTGGGYATTTAAQTPVGSSGRSVVTVWDVWAVIDDQAAPTRRYGIRWRHAGDLGEYRQRFTPCAADLPTLAAEIIKELQR